MIGKIKELFSKYRELIVYVFFGGLTTLVSWGSYFLLADGLSVYYQWAQWGSWVVAVAFAFVVNKAFVFRDKDMSSGGLFRQMWQFVSVRIASGVLEWLLMRLMVERLVFSDGISKIVVSVVTVVVNYIASKILIFKKSEDGDGAGK